MLERGVMRSWQKIRKGFLPHDVLVATLMASAEMAVNERSGHEPSFNLRRL